METAFARWLDREGLKPYSFSRLHKLNYRSVYQLAGMKLGENQRQPGFFTSPLLMEVARITGIPIDRLLADAAEAKKNPKPSRPKLSRGHKGGTDGAADQASG